MTNDLHPFERADALTEQEINHTIAELMNGGKPAIMVRRYADTAEAALELFKTLPPRTRVWWGQRWSIFNECWEYFCHIDDSDTGKTFQIDGSDSFAVTLCKAWLIWARSRQG